MMLYNVTKIVGALNLRAYHLHFLTETELMMYCYNSRRLEPQCKFTIEGVDKTTNKTQLFKFIGSDSFDSCLLIPYKEEE